MKSHAILVLVCVVSLSGCTVGPDYHAPQMPAPARFSAAATQPIAGVDLRRWWESFHDPKLNKLIVRGAEMSLDIWLAESRVREARAALGQDVAALFPKLDASASYTRGNTSQNIINSPVIPGVGTIPITGSNNPQNLYQAGFDASWELDVFGGKRRRIEASQANLQALIEARRDTTVTLLSEVARNYLIVRGAQHERAAVLDNIQAQKDTLMLIRSKFQAGISTDLDVARQEAQVSSTESQLPGIRTEMQQAIHRLGVLLDCEPEALEADLAVPGALPVGPPRVPPGLPSELLRRRSDVREAERKLAEASANIGVAVSELYPKFSLTGSYGLESTALKNFTHGTSEIWSFGPSVKWRLFDAGEIWSNVLVQKARYEQAYIQYRQVVLRALQEVEDALTAYEEERVRNESLLKSVDANVRAVGLAKQLNQAGVLDFLNVLTVQQTLFTAQDQLAQSDQTVSTNLVALYKALGGGWEYQEQINRPK